MAKIGITKILTNIAAVESASADLYAYYAQVFEAHPVAAPVFRKMKREEEGHRNQVLFQKRLVDKNPSTFEKVEIELEIFTDLVHIIRDHISQGVEDVRDAVNFALYLEGSAIESHYRTWALERYSALSDIAGFLMAGDEHHVKRLRNLRTALAEPSDHSD